MSSEIRIVWVTAPADEADRIARGLVQERVAACVNVVPTIRSVYRWQGGIEEAPEALLVIKTTAERFAALEHAVMRLHPYDVPEILAVPVSAGLPAYLAWVAEEVREG